MSKSKGVASIPCKSCRLQIDLVKAARLAESQGKRDIKCPSCNSHIGQLN